MDREEVLSFIKIALVVAVGVFIGQLFYDWYYTLLEGIGG